LSYVGVSDCGKSSYWHSVGVRTLLYYNHFLDYNQGLHGFASAKSRQFYPKRAFGISIRDTRNHQSPEKILKNDYGPHTIGSLTLYSILCVIISGPVWHLYS